MTKGLCAEEAQAAMKNSTAISKIDFSKVAAVFASGGHGMSQSAGDIHVSESDVLRKISCPILCFVKHGILIHYFCQ